MKIICVLLTLFLLSSCDQDRTLNLVMDSYLGYKQSNLIENFGKPRDISYSGTDKILEFGFEEHNFNISPFDSKDPNNIANDPALNNPGINPTITNGILNNSILNGGIRTDGSGDVSFRYGDFQGAYSRNECRLRFTVDQQDNVKGWNQSGNSCLRYATRSNINRQFLNDLPKITDKSYGIQLKSSSKGLKIKDLHPLSSASQLGLRKGDLITKINNIFTANLSEHSALMELSKYAQVKLEVLRGKEVLNLDIKKSDIPRLDRFRKRDRRFMGFR
jgi:PDZ domain